MLRRALNVFSQLCDPRNHGRKLLLFPGNWSCRCKTKDNNELALTSMHVYALLVMKLFLHLKIPFIYSNVKCNV